MKQRFIIMLIIIFALGLRLMYVSSISGKPVNNTGDEWDYDRLGLSLATGKGYTYLFGW